MSGFSDDHLLSPWKSFQSEGHLRDRQCMHDVVNGRALDEELLYVYIEPTKASRVSRGVGASIVGSLGDKWGRVVAEEADCWRLHTGCIAKKETEGWKLKWDVEKEEFFQEMASAPHPCYVHACCAWAAPRSCASSASGSSCCQL